MKLGIRIEEIDKEIKENEAQLKEAKKTLSDRLMWNFSLGLATKQEARILIMLQKSITRLKAENNKLRQLRGWVKGGG